jgi:hypothetical protein
VDACQIQLGVCVAKHLVIAPKKLELSSIERDTASFENGFKRFNAR